METNFTNLQAYTTGTDPDWKPLNYTITKEGSTQIVSIQEYSDFYDNPLPGDMAVTFSNTQQTPELPLWTLPTIIIALSAVALFYVKKKAVLVPKRRLKEACNVLSNPELNA